MTDTNPPADRTAEADMRREIVLREINQGALAGMSSEITGQAADLVLAALDKYDAWKSEQTSGDLTEVRDALRPPYMLALGNLIADAQTDTHPVADAGSTGPYIVHGCVVYDAQQLKDAVRTVWTRGPALLDRLTAAEAHVEELERQLGEQQRQLDLTVNQMHQAKASALRELQADERAEDLQRRIDKVRDIASDQTRSFVGALRAIRDVTDEPTTAPDSEMDPFEAADDIDRRCGS